MKVKFLSVTYLSSRRGPEYRDYLANLPFSIASAGLKMLPDSLDEPGLWNIIGHLGEQNSGGDWGVYFKEM
ncbi:unnamed protein product [Rhizophagus irregularis]|nr:unnamed protein product [Rhizophagus irregularis]